jgi:hypothetical protein
MHMRPGLQVARLEKAGKGQVVRLRCDECEVQWSNHGREWLPQSDLVWVTIHTHDGRAGRVIGLGRERVRVRLASGVRAWMAPNEIAPREPRQGVVSESGEENIYDGR